MFRYTDKEIDQLIKNATVVIDTREQKCSHIVEYFEKKKIPYCFEKLKVGDYTLKIQLPHMHRPYYLQDRCAIERKANLEELSGNFTKKREAFESEFARAKGIIYLLIENASYEDLVLKKYKTGYDRKLFVASLKAFEARYNIRTIFIKDNTFSGHFIYSTLIYSLKEQFKQGEL